MFMVVRELQNLWTRLSTMVYELWVGSEKLKKRFTKGILYIINLGTKLFFWDDEKKRNKLGLAVSSPGQAGAI